MPGEHGEQSEEERILREINEELDKHDPEAVKAYLLESGLAWDAIQGMKKMTQSDDPLTREEARQQLIERGLGFLLAPETDES